MVGDLTELEKQRYDRQIRVWGAEAQSRIQSSRILVCGLKGLNTEVLKNIVLAGMNVVIQDSSCVAFEDLSSSFFFTSDQVGSNAAEAAVAAVQELNSFSKVEAVSTSLEALSDDYLATFPVIVLGPCSDACALRVDAVCRAAGAVLFWLSCLFEDGWFISDFGPSFQYRADPPQNTDTRVISFPPLSQVLGKRWADLTSKFFALSLVFVQSRLLALYQDTEPSIDFVSFSRHHLEANGLSPSVLTDVQLARLSHLAEAVRGQAAGSCASGSSVLVGSVLGSVLAQEVIKAVSRTGVPGYNVFVFSGDDCSVRSFPTA